MRWQSKRLGKEGDGEEPGASGKAVIDQYRTRVLDGYSMRGDKPSGNKITRAQPVAARAEAGDLHLVGGSFTEAFLDEAEIFPDGAPDDQIDALSGAYTALARHRPFTLPVAFDPSELAKPNYWTSFDV